MKQVWKCDHCSHTDINAESMAKHEPKCSFNKATKHCYTCKFYREDGYDTHIAGCDINEDTFRGEKEGNCPGWVYEYLEKDRDEKIENILK
jgi:hypothetical protein